MSGNAYREVTQKGVFEGETAIVVWGPVGGETTSSPQALTKDHNTGSYFTATSSLTGTQLLADLDSGIYSMPTAFWLPKRGLELKTTGFAGWMTPSGKLSKWQAESTEIITTTASHLSVSMALSSSWQNHYKTMDNKPCTRPFPSLPCISEGQHQLPTALFV